MIISLRGTNGAGKSTLVRRIMKEYEERHPISIEGRRKPIGYRFYGVGKRALFIPGHYEIANGGIDTIKDLEQSYALIREYFYLGLNVLYEGKNMSDGVNLVMRYFKQDEIRIVVIDTPVDICIQSVRDRGHSIKEETIHRLARKVENDAQQFIRNGYVVIKGNREDSFTSCKKILCE